MKKMRFLPTLLIAIVVFAGGVLSATLGVNLFNQGHKVGTDTQATVSEGSEPLKAPSVEARLEWEEAFVSVAELVNPAVVQIRSAEKIETQNSIRFPQGTPFDWPIPEFRQSEPDNDPNASRRVRQGLGSGVLIRSDGYIVTNDHVVSGADKLQVLLHDGQTFPAKIIGRDPNSDLAVIQIDKIGLPTVSLDPLTNIRVGEWVMAFGSPLDEALDNTVTAGIISGIGRTSNRLARLNLYSDFIQTDAAINRGNSGGPLVNMSGQLVGINSAILSPTGNNAGIGFAIPVSIVSNVANQLIGKGRVDRGFLGIRFDRVSRSLAMALDAPPGSAQVSQVEKNSAADEAGVEAGDIIAGIDGIELADYLLLRTTIGNKSPGEKVILDVIRDRERMQIEVTLGTLPEQYAQNVQTNQTQRDDQGNLDELGLTLRDVDREVLKERFGISEDVGGVLIRSIDESSKAFDESDLRPEDIIVEVDKKPVRSVSDFRNAYKGVNSGSIFLVKVLRPQLVDEDTFELLPLMTALTKPE